MYSSNIIILPLIYLSVDPFVIKSIYMFSYIITTVCSDASVAAGKAITVLTYLHGVKESYEAIKEIQERDPSVDIDLIELNSLKVKHKRHSF